MEPTVVRLKVERELVDGAVVVRAGGAVDMGTVDDLTVALTAALRSTAEGTATLVIIDLHGVTYFGSAGLNAVLRCHERGTATGIPVRLVADNPEVVRPIEVTGLDAVLRMYPTVDAALRPPRETGPA
ncbi:STAS domain-containing protein [Nocardia sp. 2]|uniref:Anti-sigma factor antagonist n=1 Tax=Nocardia acididurans TaxID=2802282 RepID=A0ABS1M8N5_9NOCA|nr:STAS domain-containing protein [Nocardia acididurans]MBL1076395.1 STAS domain-containing protein [Nocardia acididurans]